MNFIISITYFPQHMRHFVDLFILFAIDIHFFIIIIPLLSSIFLLFFSYTYAIIIAFVYVVVID